MRASKDPKMTAPKHKELSIHILTDHTGPHGIPLVYGSTPDKLGSIKGVVRFSCHPDCRGKDIVILYEAKAEAHWTALENKKLVEHNTEEILGHHIWHFPLEHTKQGGSTIVAGIYEKEIEVLLAHPADQHRLAAAAASTTSPPSSPLPSHATIPLRQQQQQQQQPQPLQQQQQLLPPPGSALPSTVNHLIPPFPASLLSAHRQSRPWALLPSSSYGPHASMRYTIRAILRRPFPNMNIEASQEVWVLHSTLPPMKPSRSLSLHPRSRSAAPGAGVDLDKRRGQRSPHRSLPTQALTKKRATTTTTTTTTETETKDLLKRQQSTDSPDKTQLTPDSEANPLANTDEAATIKTPAQDPPPRSLLSLPLPSIPTKAIKSALSSLLPSIELPRLKQAADLKGDTTVNDAEEKQKECTGAAASTSSSSSPSPRSTHLSCQATSTTPTTSHGDPLSDDGSETSTWAAGSPKAGRDRTIPSINRIGETSEEDEEDEVNQEDQAEYTGVWEPFRIPYSCSIPSETVYLGQEIPLRIRFGPRPRRRSTDARAMKPPHGAQPPGPPLDRFVVKKGLLKLMEHTILREVSVTPTANTPRPLSKKSLQNLAAAQQQQLPLQDSTSGATPVSAVVSRKDSIRSVRPESYHDQGSVKPTSHKFLWFGNKSSTRSKQGSHNEREASTVSTTMTTGRAGAIYQEQAYNGSHSHLFDLYPTTEVTDPKTLHSMPLMPPQPQQLPSDQQDSVVHRRYQSSDLKRLLFKPKRHSMDHSYDSATTFAAAANLVNPQQLSSLSPVLRPSSPPLTPTSPTLPPPPPPHPSQQQQQQMKLASPPRSGATRMINSVEAKFKTEVNSTSLTPMLQQQERRYLQQRERRLCRQQGRSRGAEQTLGRKGTNGESDGTKSEEEEEGESEDEYDEGEEEEDDVWETVISVQIPGPSELAPETETKNIVRTHTLQLMLLCGVVPPSSGRAKATPQHGADGAQSPASSPTSLTPSTSLSSSPPCSYSPSPASMNLALNEAATTMTANREFRLEMDLHVTGPRSPAILS